MKNLKELRNTTEVDEYFCLIPDDDGHWYVIPASRKDDWWEWVEDYDNWEAPEWAKAVGGAPSGVLFSKWKFG